MKKKLILISLSLALLLSACSKEDNYEVGTINNKENGVVDKKDKDEKAKTDTTKPEDKKSDVEIERDKLMDSEESKDIERVKKNDEVSIENFKPDKPFASISDSEAKPSPNASNEDLRKIGTQLKRLLTVDSGPSSYQKRLAVLKKLNVDFDEKDFYEAWSYMPANNKDLFASDSTSYNIKDDVIEVYVSAGTTPKTDGINDSELLRRLRRFMADGEAKEFHMKTAIFKYSKEGDRYKIKLMNKWWMQ